MMGRALLDANEAVASVAYRLNEVCATCPIAPSSPMAELAERWSAEGRRNIFGAVPTVIEMQSEAGAAGALHGALQSGAIGTAFTASQGLLFMISDLYEIAGELTPAVLHVAARAGDTQALGDLGDHSAVMAVRQTGWALLCASSAQEAHDLAAVAQMATLRARVPFVHFFDGRSASREVSEIALLSDEDLRALVDREPALVHRGRAPSPERLGTRVMAQDPDDLCRAREALDAGYVQLPSIVEEAMTALASRTGRAYRLCEYFGHEAAERVIVLMGSGAEAARETVEHLRLRGERVGVLQVRLFRPFPAARLLAALPATVRALAVLERTREPGAQGGPLYRDVVTALWEATEPGGQRRVIAGRSGAGELTPAMVKAVLDELAAPAPRRRFAIGVTSDACDTSLPGLASEAGQLLRPLLGPSDGHAGCGEAPYLKLAARLFGDRMIVVNATGSSSCHGGTLPTAPSGADAAGRSRAWLRSLFADDAAFGLGFRLAADRHLETARRLLRALRPLLPGVDVDEILDAPQRLESELAAQRDRVEALHERLRTLAGTEPRAAELLSVVDHLLRRSVWIVGGEGWACDLGAGGLDRVLASGRDVNVLVLDTEVSLRTGDQDSEVRPLRVAAELAAAGGQVGKDDLALQAISYENVYVARVALGADPQQTLLALRGAEAHPGPSLIIAYGQCVVHGGDLRQGLRQEELAVQTGYWRLLRYDPALRGRGEGPLLLDSPRPRPPLRDRARGEVRCRSGGVSAPDERPGLLRLAEEALRRRPEAHAELAADRRA